MKLIKYFSIIFILVFSISNAQDINNILENEKEYIVEFAKPIWDGGSYVLCFQSEKDTIYAKYCFSKTKDNEALKGQILLSYNNKFSNGDFLIITNDNRESFQLFLLRSKIRLEALDSLLRYMESSSCDSENFPIVADSLSYILGNELIQVQKANLNTKDKNAYLKDVSLLKKTNRNKKIPQ